MGRVLDPVADKVFTAGVLGTLIWEGNLTLGDMLLVGVRDLVVIAGTLVGAMLQMWPTFDHMAPTLLGKTTTAAQFAFFLVLVAVPEYKGIALRRLLLSASWPCAVSVAVFDAALNAVTRKRGDAMADKPNLNHPWLVAVWPGMGHVALNAGYYLLAKLDMHVIAEFEAANLFDVDHVEVSQGLIEPVGAPRNRFFLWSDPSRKRDLVVFLGEAQPPIGKFAFCHRLIEFARDLGVERVFTFAAMATQMHPAQGSRVFGAATDQQSLEELKRLELELLQDGNIGGLNGVLLGAAAVNNLHGACLLGEMPHIFAQLPYPKASQAILEVFTTISGIELDFTELAEQVRNVDEQLGGLLAQVEKQYGQQFPPAAEDDEGYRAEAVEEDEKASPADHERIEDLFAAAKKDRTKAFELKQLLDRLGIFKEYENRFLDLFKKPGPAADPSKPPP